MDLLLENLHLSGLVGAPQIISFQRLSIQWRGISASKIGSTPINWRWETTVSRCTAMWKSSLYLLVLLCANCGSINSRKTYPIFCHMLQTPHWSFVSMNNCHMPRKISSQATMKCMLRYSVLCWRCHWWFWQIGAHQRCLSGESCRRGDECRSNFKAEKNSKNTVPFYILMSII